MDETLRGVMEAVSARLDAAAVELRTAVERAAAAPAADPRGMQHRARRLLAERRRRSRLLPGELFGEPAWDMLLALFDAYHDGRTMNVGALVTYAEAPATTSQRWIEHLHRLGLIQRTGDPVDRRRVEVALSDRGLEAVGRYLGEQPAD